MEKLTRSYDLPIYPNTDKLDTIRLLCNEYLHLTQHFVNQKYYNRQNPSFKTNSRFLGTLGNQAQHTAEGIVSGLKESSKECKKLLEQKIKSIENKIKYEKSKSKKSKPKKVSPQKIRKLEHQLCEEQRKLDNFKTSCPELKFKCCPASIFEANETSYDYWIKILHPFPDPKNPPGKHDHGKFFVPANSIKPLNKALRDGWILSEYCEPTFRDGTLYVRVFVTKEKPPITSTNECMGADVGKNHLVARSDGYLSQSANKILEKSKKKQASRNKQRSKKQREIYEQNKLSGLDTRFCYPSRSTLGKTGKAKTKSSLKQQLDIEVNRAIARCKARSLSLAVEDPKVLANLRCRDSWARCYFARRAWIRGAEEGVRVVFVYPSWSSLTCWKCRTKDKRNRQGEVFICINCKYEAHADTNASKIIAERGLVELIRREKSWTVRRQSSLISTLNQVRPIST